MPNSRDFELFVDGLSLPNFRGREFTPYWSRVRSGVRNGVPPESLWNNIVPTLVVLQKLRTELGVWITLTSTYRRPAYNRAIAGAGASFHMDFKAIDFSCATGSPSDWARSLKGYRGQAFDLPGIHGDYIFRGGVGIYDTFVHIDTRGWDANW